MIEHFFQCPHCWQEISMLLDTSLSTSYIEDCEVCCNPIQVTTVFNDGVLTNCEARSIEQ